MKKLICLLVMVTMVVSMFVGCGQKDESVDVKDSSSEQKKDNGKKDANDSQSSEEKVENFNATGFPIVNEKITLTVMGPKIPLHGPWEEMAFFKEMEKLTNIHIDYITVPGNAWKEKLNLAFASGELPDIILGGSRSGAMTIEAEGKYGAQGYLIPLEEYIDRYGTNMKKVFEQRPDIKKAITSADGHIYSLPQVNDATIAKFNTAWVNNVWLENLGITKLPENTDELYELLKTFKESDANKNGEADEIPLAARNTLLLREYMLPAFGVFNNTVEVKEDTIRYGAREEGYREYLKFMKKLYDEQLLDNECFTNTTQQMYAKGKENKVGVFYGAVPGLAYAGAEESHPALGTLTSDINSERMYRMRDGIFTPAYTLTIKNQYPEASIRWADYLWSKEGELLAHYGPEGMYYTIENGVKVKITPPEGMSTEQLRGSLTPDVGVPMPKYTTSEVERNWDNAFVEHRFIENETKHLPYGKIPLPKLRFTEDELKTINAIKTDLEKYVLEMEAKFITGFVSIEEWDDYVATLEKMDVDEYVAIYQTAYERWKNIK